MRISTETIDFSLVRSLLKEGHRTALFLRHSERPPISPDDKEFGRTLGLTPRGVELARQSGEMLSGYRDVRFFSSPMARCRLTARHFAEGMGLPHAEIEDADPLGVRGFYYDDPYAVQDLMRQQGYMAYMLEYLRNGIAPYSRPIGPATEQTAEWMRSAATAKLTLFFSHDIFIAAFLTGLKVRSFCAEDWVGFLHGAALVQDPKAGWICHPCVPALDKLAAAPHFVH